MSGSASPALYSLAMFLLRPISSLYIHTYIHTSVIIIVKSIIHNSHPLPTYLPSSGDRDGWDGRGAGVVLEEKDDDDDDDDNPLLLLLCPFAAAAAIVA